MCLQRIDTCADRKITVVRQQSADGSPLVLLIMKQGICLMAAAAANSSLRHCVQFFSLEVLSMQCSCILMQQNNDGTNL